MNDFPAFYEAFKKRADNPNIIYNPYYWLGQTWNGQPITEGEFTFRIEGQAQTTEWFFVCLIHNPSYRRFHVSRIPHRPFGDLPLQPGEFETCSGCVGTGWLDCHPLQIRLVERCVKICRNYPRRRVDLAGDPTYAPGRKNAQVREALRRSQLQK